MVSQPLDLVYVCGNKFLATNSSSSTLDVTYRVVGTQETGGITLDKGQGGDPGHSEAELETSARGVVELYYKDELVARRQNEGLPCGSSAISSVVAGVTTAEAGHWSEPFYWPAVAVHLTLLPNGRVLSWGATRTQPQVWNPVTGNFTEVPEPVELFCAGQTLLPDGRVLVAGGHISDDHGLRDITIFNPSTQTWSRSTPMRRGRWYPTTTTLASGAVVITAGRDESGNPVTLPEVWESGTLRVLTSAGRALAYYPRAFQAPNGRLFYAGEERRSRYLNTSGTGSWSSVGDRMYGTRDYGAAVMYDDGKILYVGGGRTTNTAEVIDLNAGTPQWRWSNPMAFRRRHHNATVLPTGEVLVTGGTSGTSFDDQTQRVRAAEIWNPVTENWTTLASNSVTRTYHGTSILLPDGRVLHAGSGSSRTPHEFNAELFSPPYLFKGARPTISSAPTSVGYGASFTVGTAQASSITRVSFIRLGSTTHAFDMNQRFQRLSFTRQSGALRITAPSNRNRTPPGHYMLFILNTAGVPSVAKIIRIN
jgi:galactose oxidase